MTIFLIVVGSALLSIIIAFLINLFATNAYVNDLFRKYINVVLILFGFCVAALIGLTIFDGQQKSAHDNNATLSVIFFVFGTVLVLISLLGGGFELFGARISPNLTIPARVFAGIIGTVFIFIGLTGTTIIGPGGTTQTPTQTPAHVSSITQIAVTQIIVTSQLVVISPPIVITNPSLVVTATPPPLSVPTVVFENFEAEWPPEMQLKQSDEVRVSLVYTSGQTLTPIIEVPGHTAIIGTPIPFGTPGPLAAALGPEYDTFIIATLGSTAFEVVPATAEEYRLLGPTKVTWIWNVIPKYRGNQILNVSVDVRWEPKNGEKPVQSQVWRKRLETTVGGPLFEIGDPIQITPILTALGGALAVWFGPRLYNWGVAEIRRIGKQKQKANNRRPRR